MCRIGSLLRTSNRLPGGTTTCHPDAPYLLASAASYSDDRVKHLIWQLKYERRRAAAHALGALVAGFAAPLTQELHGAALVPIPLHKKRLRERGFNQSELIARAVSRRTGLTLRTDLIRRVRETAPQAECREREERINNMSGCFALRPGAALPKGRIVLVDDVTTSGATLSEAAACLKAAGARGIIGLVSAKAG